MPIYLLGEEHRFPGPAEAEPDGLLAVGGDLHPERLLEAYRNGIFPWYSDGEPILWYSPPIRAVIRPAEVRVGRTLRRRLAHAPFRLSMDEAFDDVVIACARTRRKGQDGTWITRDMALAYRALHELGFAHSLEVWEAETLVGGLYGISLGAVFCGESMFSARADASKIALVALARQLDRWSFTMIDCQLPTDHLKRMGAVEMDRGQFLTNLRTSLRVSTRPGPWALDDDVLGGSSFSALLDT